MGESLSNLKRTRRSLAALIIVVVAIVGILGSPASSHDGHDHSREIRIIEVSGLLDPIEIDYIDSQIEDAQRQWALAIVLQINSPGSTSDRQEVRDLLQNIEGSLVPVGAWIGQSGATAQGAAAHLVQAADYSGIAPGSRIGNFAEFTTSTEPPTQVGAHDLRRGEDAVDAGLVNVMAPTLGEFLLAMEDAEPVSYTHLTLPTICSV